jgi:phosphoglycolate phosphatase
VTNSSAALFDLDGTLIDPAGGITEGIAHALQSLGLAVPSDAALAGMVGPKLSDSLLGRTDATAEQVPELISIYRQWYLEHGIAMGRVYPGLVEVLAELQAEGVPLGVATQKPQSLAVTVLRAHGLDSYFQVISGSSDDESILPGQPGYRGGKKEIIAAALAATGADTAVMVGDRAQDVNGAAANGLPCIGVAWGFAEHGELASAGAVAVVQDAAGLMRELVQRLGLKEPAHGAL